MSEPDDATRVGAADAAADAPPPAGAPPSPPPPKAASGARVALWILGILLTLYLGAVLGPPLRAALGRIVRAATLPAGPAGARATQYYTCPMHPWVIEPHPGHCPICGMTLVPLNPAKFTGEITIDPVVVQNIGVRTAPVTEGTAATSLRTVGTVTYDETRLVDVNLKVAGWIERLHVDYQGQAVRAGQPLFELYSPDLFAAQEEYLLAFRAARKAGGGPGAADLARQLLEPARTKLRYYDIGPAQIAALEARGTPQKTMTIRSPRGGVVIEKHVFAGMKVTPGTTAYRIADLSDVWVQATLYEYQSREVKVGQPARMTLTYLPGQTFTGTVAYVYPYLDQHTRQLNVRLQFPNPKRALKPGMFATVVFDTASPVRHVLAPRAAILDTGRRQVAFVYRGHGHFEPRNVTMGADAGDGRVEILTGLAPGEEVVVNGQFLIDSEARMREALARLIRKGLVAAPASAPASAPATAPAPVTVRLPPAATRALGAALHAYLDVAATLAHDTTRDVGVAARRLAAAATALAAAPPPDQPHFWHEHPEPATVAAQARALADAGSVDEARRALATLSAALARLVRLTGVPRDFGRQVDELHCPMYPPGGSGAVWLQAAGPVRNPYFGAVMPTCADRRAPLPEAP